MLGINAKPPWNFCGGSTRHHSRFLDVSRYAAHRTAMQQLPIRCHRTFLAAKQPDRRAGCALGRRRTFEAACYGVPRCSTIAIGALVCLKNTANGEVFASALHIIIEKLPPAGTAALRFSVGRKQGDARPSTERSAQSPEDAVCLGQAHRFFRRETTLRTVRAAGAPAASPSGGAGGSFRHRRIRLTHARAPHLPAAGRSLEARSVRKAR